MNFLPNFQKYWYNIQNQLRVRTYCSKFLENYFFDLNIVVGNGQVVIVIKCGNGLST